MTTFLELKDRVNDATRNWNFYQSSTAEGDGIKSVFVMPDMNCVPESEVVTIDDVTQVRDIDYVIGNETGTIVFTATPALGAVIIVAYLQARFSDTEVGRAVNSGIDAIYPEFHVYGFLNKLTQDTSTQDYILPEDVEQIIRVECYSRTWGNHPAWEPRNRPQYSVVAYSSDYLATTVATTLRLTTGGGYGVNVNDVLKEGSECVFVTAVSGDVLTVTRGYAGTTAATHSAGGAWGLWGSKYLHFKRNIGSYPFRVHYVARGANLSNANDTLETTSGLPSRAANAIVAYACWSLVKEAEVQRVLDDRSHNTTGGNVLRAYEITNVASAFMQRFQYELLKNRMKPWSRA